MEELNEQEIGLVEQYKKTKNEDIALYFFNKYREDISNIIFYKINKKFSSIPLEKGDLFHLVWNSIKKTLNEYDGGNFNSIVVKNCYFLTIKEIKKFLNNGELLMNISHSYDSYLEKPRRVINKNLITGIEVSRKDLLNKLINDACNYVKIYSQPTIKKVIYLKSLGYSVSEISRMIRKSRYHVEHLLKLVEEMVKDMNF